MWRLIRCKPKHVTLTHGIPWIVHVSFQLNDWIIDGIIIERVESEREREQKIYVYIL